MTAEVDIVIVNWNSGAMLQDCIASVARAPEGVGWVIVVDNGSSDGSAAVAAPGLRVEVVETGRNLGFSRASNLGAARASADYVLFLNPDAEVEEDTIARALAFMESPEASDVAICGIQLVNDDGVVERHCAPFPTVRTYIGLGLGLYRIFPKAFPPRTLTAFDHLQSRRVDHVIGAFYFVRRAVFETLGRFDERFFVYLEDVDFSRRAADAGWSAYYLAEARGYHKGGGLSRQVPAHRLFYSARSQIVYGFKHLSATGAWATLVSTAIMEPMARILAAAVRGDGRTIAQIASAYRMLAGDVRNIRRMIATLRAEGSGAER